MSESIELTILMPCLNEAETLEICIQKANRFLEEHKVSGEILIADNGSTDGSQKIAESNGARVVNVLEKGYGSALIGGCNAALGKYVIMGDADDSYDFMNLMPFLTKLREGYDLVMGNRFQGGIAKGAMPPLHKYLGNPILSFVGRIFYSSQVRDFHCGLRGYNTQAMQSLNLRTTGMEYASEMVVQATLHKYKMIEVPTTLSPDGRTRTPHLRSWSDGWRHLKFLFMHSPNWLFLYPGVICSLIGLVMTTLLLFGPITVIDVTFDIHTMLYSSALLIIGVNTVLFSLYTKAYAIHSKFIPVNHSIKYMEKITIEKGILSGVLLFLLGIIVTILAFVYWQQKSFGGLDPQKVMRITIPALTLMVTGIQIIYGSFFLGILNIKQVGEK